jgi:hypothetical protein
MRAGLLLPLLTACLLGCAGEPVLSSPILEAGTAASTTEPGLLLREARPPWPRDLQGAVFVAYLGVLLLAVAALRSRRLLLGAVALALITAAAAFTYESRVGVDREAGALWRRRTALFGLLQSEAVLPLDHLAALEIVPRTAPLGDLGERVTGYAIVARPAGGAGELELIVVDELEAAEALRDALRGSLRQPPGPAACRGFALRDRSVALAS